MDELRKNLVIDQTNIDEELCRQSANYLFVSERAVEADVAHEKFKAQMGELEATLDNKIRSSKEGVKTTEAAIRMEMERHPDYIKAQRILIEMRGRREMVKALRESYYMRKDCLIQLAIKQRAELASLGTTA